MTKWRITPKILRLIKLKLSLLSGKFIIKKHLRNINIHYLGLIIFVSVIFFSIWFGWMRFDINNLNHWLGFQEYVDINGIYYPGKTLWDWLDLFIVPLVLLIAAYWINQNQKKNELNLSADRQHEELLQSYIDKMEGFLKVKGGQLSTDSENNLQNIASVRTITTIRNLDTRRKNTIFQFLRDSKLGEQILNRASLNETNLSKTNISHISFKHAEMEKSNLHGLEGAYADFYCAQMKDTNMENAYLLQANFEDADLRRANLDNAKLYHANLSEVKMRNTTLRRAKLLGADLSHASILNADLTGAEFMHANCTGAVFSGSTMVGAGFLCANLSETYFKDVNAKWVSFREANLKDSDFQQADLRLANFSDACLDGANFSRAKISAKQIIKAKSFVNIIMPDGNPFTP